jgi:hypothetical protein
MLEFSEFPDEPSARTMFSIVSQSEGPVSAYIGLFEDLQHEEVRNLVLHGLKRYVQKLGDRSTWHDRIFAFAGDVIDGSTQTVEITQGVFWQHKTKQQQSPTAASRKSTKPGLTLRPVNSLVHSQRQSQGHEPSSPGS